MHRIDFIPILGPTATECEYCLHEIREIASFQIEIRRDDDFLETKFACSLCAANHEIHVDDLFLEIAQIEEE